MCFNTALHKYKYLHKSYIWLSKRTTSFLAKYGLANSAFSKTRWSGDTRVFSAEKLSQLLYVGRRNEQLCERYPVLYKNCSSNMFITMKDS